MFVNGTSRVTLSFSSKTHFRTCYSSYTGSHLKAEYFRLTGLLRAKTKTRHSHSSYAAKAAEPSK